MNWNNYYMEQAGGSSDFSNVYRGAPWQRGYGLGGYFRRFFNWAIPMIKDQAISTLKTGAETVGKEALTGISNFASDISQGKDLKTSIEENTSKSINNLKQKAVKYFKGKDIKRRKKNKKVPHFKTKRKKE